MDQARQPEGGARFPRGGMKPDGAPRAGSPEITEREQ